MLDVINAAARFDGDYVIEERMMTYDAARALTRFITETMDSSRARRSLDR